MKLHIRRFEHGIGSRVTARNADELDYSDCIHNSTSSSHVVAYLARPNLATIRDEGISLPGLAEWTISPPDCPVHLSRASAMPRFMSAFM
jgi:hypothetical protein